MLDLSKLPSSVLTPPPAPRASERPLLESASGVTSAAFTGAGERGARLLVKRYNQRFATYLRGDGPTLARLRALAGQPVVGLPALVEASDDTDGLVLVMRSIPGESLEQDMAARPTPVDAALGRAAVRALALGIDQLHQHGLMHLDLRPASVVFEAVTGTASTLDLGHTVPILDDGLGPAGFPGAGLGGAAYASMELLAGARPHPSDDVYALACVAYEMLAGVHPFGRRGAADAASFGVQPAPIAALDPQANDVLLKALALTREQRTVGLRDLAQAMQMGAAPVTANEETRSAFQGVSAAAAAGTESGRGRDAAAEAARWIPARMMASNLKLDDLPPTGRRDPLPDSPPRVPAPAPDDLSAIRARRAGRPASEIGMPRLNTLGDDDPLSTPPLQPDPASFRLPFTERPGEPSMQAASAPRFEERDDRGTHAADPRDRYAPPPPPRSRFLVGTMLGGLIGLLVAAVAVAVVAPEAFDRVRAALGISVTPVATRAPAAAEPVTRSAEPPTVATAPATPPQKAAPPAATQPAPTTPPAAAAPAAPAPNATTPPPTAAAPAATASATPAPAAPPAASAPSVPPTGIVPVPRAAAPAASVPPPVASAPVAKPRAEPVPERPAAYYEALRGCPTCSCGDLRTKRFVRSEPLAWEEASYLINVCERGG